MCLSRSREVSARSLEVSERSRRGLSRSVEVSERSRRGLSRTREYCNTRGVVHTALGREHVWRIVGGWRSVGNERERERRREERERERKETERYNLFPPPPPLLFIGIRTLFGAYFLVLTFCINSTRGRGGHESPRWMTLD
jgi:hypothetical protein